MIGKTFAVIRREDHVRRFPKSKPIEFVQHPRHRVINKGCQPVVVRHDFTKVVARPSFVRVVAAVGQAIASPLVLGRLVAHVLLRYRSRHLLGIVHVAIRTGRREWLMGVGKGHPKKERLFIVAVLKPLDRAIRRPMGVVPFGRNRILPTIERSRLVFQCILALPKLKALRVVALQPNAPVPSRIGMARVDLSIFEPKVWAIPEAVPSNRRPWWGVVRKHVFQVSRLEVSLAYQRSGVARLAQ